MKTRVGFTFAAFALISAPFVIVAGEEGADRSESASPAESRSVASDAESAAARRANRKRTGETRYGWTWLAERFDKDGDGAISEEELPAPDGAFERLDRNWDGALTRHDFDWAAGGELCQQKETAFALFKATDTTSNGRITPEEWQAMFAEVAGEKGYLDDEDLERFMYLPRVVKTRGEERFLASREGRQFDRSQRESAAPRPGEMAPDFELRSPDGKSAVRLSSLRGKPVVLVFGCYTCGNYRTYSDAVEAIYRRWKDEAEFLRVYVREAHPVGDQPATSTNAKAGILIKQPTSLEERCSVAGRFCEALAIGMPVVVDKIDNRVGDAYASWPDRLYIVDREGRIAYQGGPGPFGFNPREMEQALLLMLLDQEQGER